MALQEEGRASSPPPGVELVSVVASVDREQQRAEGGEKSAVCCDKGAEVLDRGDSQQESTVSGGGAVPLRTLALSSVVAAGVQFGWALQLSLLTPYIQTLGIKHGFSSFIWLCGPVTGLVVQPCVGAWSDKCKLKYGRRRPFILAGVFLICLAVISIGFAADIGYLLGDTHEHCQTFRGTRVWAAVVFVLGFWLLDLANNTVQGPARALLADLSGSEQRDSANAIFCLWIALGNILGFSAGASGQWHKWFPFVTSRACCDACGNLKAAFLVAVVCLVVCTAVTLWFANETPLLVKPKQSGDSAPLLNEQNNKSEDLQDVSIGELPENAIHMFETSPENVDTKWGANRSSEPDHEVAENLGHGPGSVFINLLTSIRQLPTAMKSVLMVTALCWMSWFPFFLFDTDWMGREVYQGDPQKPDKAGIYQKGVQEGTFGLLLNSVVLGISSFLIDPLCRRLGSNYVWALSNFIIFMCMASTAIISSLALHQEEGVEHLYLHTIGTKIAAVTIFALLGVPLAVTYSVPYSITAELASDSGGQGLAMGVLNIAVVVPQMIVALGAGPWDTLFGGGNEPAFALASIFAFAAGVVAMVQLPQLAREGYRPASHGFG